MWGPGPWGPAMPGLWWIFPLIGFVMCLAFLFVIFRFIMNGRGAMWMGRHQKAESSDVAEMRREIQALRNELKEARSSR